MDHDWYAIATHARARPRDCDTIHYTCTEDVLSVCVGLTGSFILLCLFLGMTSDENSRSLSQKQHPRMALIRPAIDLTARTMTLVAPDMPPLVVPLDTLPDTVQV
jgi:hypothetical protein